MKNLHTDDTEVSIDFDSIPQDMFINMFVRYVINQFEAEWMLKMYNDSYTNGYILGHDPADPTSTTTYIHFDKDFFTGFSDDGKTS